MAKKMKNPTTTTTTTSTTISTGVSSANGATLTTSNSNINYVTSGYSAISTIYHILGEDFDTSNYLDGTTAVMICTLNVLGRPFYEELKKNKISFPQKMDEFIQQRLKVLERDSKIESIIENKSE
jgi:hypothetical protein